ncbi:MAG: AmmeMemoRadiSam system radical SAM enzyme [Planctomycetota bacterium]|jgi:pyruvate formate lyase activating enzyme
MKEASLWTPGEEGRADCFLCAHRCRIAPGKRGVCGVRENRDGTLVTLTYGRLISRAVDPIEKKPLYHFLPGTPSYSIATAGCNLRCDFCQNWQISQIRAAGPVGSGGDELPGEAATPQEIAADAERSGCATIAYTYTEPTIFFEFARDTSLEAHERGIANVFVTNGFMTPETVEVMKGVVDAANVDLKGFTEDFYREFCGGRLAPVLESIRAMHSSGIHVEVTTLVIPGRNDSDSELAGIAEFVAGLSVDVAWHVSAFHPDYKTTGLRRTSPGTLDHAVELGRAAGLRYVYTGNISGGETDTGCPSCGAAVVTRRGLSARALGLDVAKGVRLGNCSACGEGLPIVTDAFGRSG